MFRKFGIILTLIIILSYPSLYQKSLAVKTNKPTAVSTYHQSIIGYWLGKGVDTYSGQSYEIALAIIKQANKQLSCDMQITDSGVICKHYLEILPNSSKATLKISFKDLACETISGQPRPGSILQQVWSNISLQPFAAGEKLVGTALINQVKLSLSLDKRIDNNNNSKSAKSALSSKVNTQKISTLEPIATRKALPEFNNQATNKSDSDNSNDLNTASDNSIITENDKISSTQTNSPKYMVRDLPDNTDNDSNIPDKYKLPPNKVLQAGIEHSASLEPVPPYLRTGAIYDEKLLKSQVKSSRIWYRIPNWLAGTWHRNYELILKSSNPYLDTPGRKFLSEGDLNYGYQVDKYNNIWDTTILPSFWDINAHNQASEVTKGITFTYKPGDYRNPNYMYLQRDREICMNKFTNRITKIRQNEEIHTITLMEPAVIRVLGSIKWFNDFGLPLYQDQRITFEKLKAPFTPVNFSETGEDLKADFIEYLKNHGLDDLIPN